jgi:hypothetical protein
VSTEEEIDQVHGNKGKKWERRRRTERKMVEEGDKEEEKKKKKKTRRNSKKYSYKKLKEVRNYRKPKIHPFTTIIEIL